MSKITFIFLGQGAQACGVGKDFYEQTEAGRRIFDKAIQLMRFSMPQLCFGKNDRLDITGCTQAAMVTVNIAMVRVLEENGIRPDVVTGLSLGEYCALAAAGVMSDEDVTWTVRQRGILMQEVVPVDEGAMAAILALDAAAIKGMTRAMEGVWIANYNCPRQIVISGEKIAMEKACEKLEAAEARRVVTLNISGPFHSGVLTAVGGKLGQVLSRAELREPRIPYVANMTAQYIKGTAEVEELLTRQVSSSVKWQRNVETTIGDGVGTFIETGPGRTLAGFVRKTSRDMKTLNVEKLEDIGKAAEALKS